MAETTDQNSITAKELRDHLFGQIKALNNPDADLEKELKKANAISSLSTVIINSIKAETDYRRQLTAEEKFLEEKNKNAGKQNKQIGNGEKSK